jgi:YHS domain-containing protein
MSVVRHAEVDEPVGLHDLLGAQLGPHSAAGRSLVAGVVTPHILFIYRSRLMRLLVALLSAVVFVPSSSHAAELALGGHCAVCLIEMGKLVPGSDQYTASFDRQVYRFPSDNERKMFLADPARYAPALGGDCTVCRVNMGVRMPGSAEFVLVHNRRAYLFPSAKEREAFQAEPTKYERADLALGGHCSVCVVMAGKWVLGKPEFTSVYDGVRYVFPGSAEKKAFEADPAKYTPALEGDCVICLKDAGKRMRGALDFSAKHEGRLYLFPDDAARQRFLAAPGTYAAVDLANGGNCVVCAKMMAGKSVPGSAEFTSVYKGLRYFFPSAKERRMFDADPAAFVGQGAKVGATQAAEIRVVGKTACAGCAYGVKPIGDSASLGIAVVADGKVYVVEGGEKRFPQVFADRFDGLTVELTGAIKRERGNFVWVEPRALRQAN